ncbi:MAG: transposase [Prosthecochloris sp.]|nr:transposase [Prosthecochloris sp.]
MNKRIAKKDDKKHQLPKRKHLRLPEYDYAQEGVYFVTVCTQDKKCLFGDVVDTAMVLNDAGEMVKRCWQEIPVHFPHVALDCFVVMPNHVHGIVFIGDASGIVGAKNFSPLRFSKPCNNIQNQRPSGTSKTIGSIVRGFKIGVTKWMRQNTSTHKVWQRNYFERVIRNERELHEMQAYITNNPLKWTLDHENPDCTQNPKHTP